MTLFVCSPVDTDSFILRHLAWSLQLRYWRLHLAWSLQLYCLQLTIFSLLCSAYYVQLTIFNLLSSALLSLAYRLQLTLFSLLSSAYYLQLTVFSLQSLALLSSAYCLQLTLFSLLCPRCSRQVWGGAVDFTIRLSLMSEVDNLVMSVAFCFVMG